MPATITIVTPENVEIRYELAGIGSRVLAASLDGLIQLVVVVVAAYLLSTLNRVGLKLPSELSPWLMGAAIILLFGFFWGYSIFFESRWSGQTPGKRWLRLRVIKDGGYPIDFRAAMLRNLMRYVDWLPSFYGLGLVSIFFSRDYKRLGDFVAGTLVIHEANPDKRRDHRPPAGSAPGSRPIGAAARSDRSAAGDDPSSLVGQPFDLTTAADLPPFEVAHVTRAEYQAVRHFLDRRDSLPAPTRDRLAARLAAPLAARLQRPEGERPADPQAFLEAVARWYERTHGS